MAKPTRYATPICAVMSVIAAIGILLGLWLSSPLVVLIAMAPSVVYEVYRTEGESTRWASWTMLGVLILEFALIVFGISFDVAGFMGSSQQEVAGYRIPLGEIAVVGPALIGVLSLVLVVRTRGRYTRWLAVNILLSAVALVYILSPDVAQELLRQGAQEGFDSM